MHKVNFPCHWDDDHLNLNYRAELKDMDTINRYWLSRSTTFTWRLISIESMKMNEELFEEYLSII